MSDEFRNNDFYEAYEVVKKLGEGTFGTVSLCIFRDSKKEYAIKTICTNKMPLNQIQTEVEICQKLEHKNIIKLVEYYADHDVGMHHLVLEMLWGGELYDDIIARQCYCEMEASHCIEQILQGVAYIHENSIVHRDLKPDNVLLTNNERDIVVKIADFGTAVQLQEDEGFRYLGDFDTLGYAMAPEMWRGSICTQATDLWSCGALLYIMLYGKPPFDSEGVVLLEDMSNSSYDFPDENSEDTKDLIHALLNPNQHERPTAEHALMHPFITKYEILPSRFKTRDVRAEHTAVVSTAPDSTPAFWGEPDVEYYEQVITGEAIVPLQEAAGETSSVTVSKVGKIAKNSSVTDQTLTEAVKRKQRGRLPLASKSGYGPAALYPMGQSVRRQDDLLISRKRPAPKLATTPWQSQSKRTDKEPRKRSAPVLFSFFKKCRSNENDYERLQPATTDEDKRKSTPANRKNVENASMTKEDESPQLITGYSDYTKQPNVSKPPEVSALQESSPP